MDNKKIGLFIATLRKEKEMTQKELSEKLFISDKAISKWERGLCMPDISLIEKIANILEVSVSEILKGEKLELISKDCSDSLVKNTIPFFQQSYFKKKFTKIIMIISLIWISGYLLLLWIGELNGGVLSYKLKAGEIIINLPSYSQKVAKMTASKMMKAFKEYNYKELEKHLIPNTFWSLMENQKELSDASIYISTGEIHPEDYQDSTLEKDPLEIYLNNLKELDNSGLKIKRYKLSSCYNLTCYFDIEVEYNNKKYGMSLGLENSYGKYITIIGLGFNSPDIFGNTQTIEKIKYDDYGFYMKIEKAFRY